LSFNGNGRRLDCFHDMDWRAACKSIANKPY
jgi:hypothetical protein